MNELLPVHPVLAALETVGAALKDVADVDPTFMTTADKKAALVALAGLHAQLEELDLRVLATADDVAYDEGCRDQAAWLAFHTRIDGSAARARLRMAQALDTTFTQVRTAMAEGTVNTGQATALVRSLAQLPTDVDPEIRSQAETRLVDEAHSFAPKQLRVLGRRVLDVVAPEVGESHEQRALEAEEAHAERVTYLHTRDFGDGTSELRPRVANTVLTRLMTYLDAHTSPRQCPDDKRPYDQRLGSAFGTFLEHIDPTRLPLHGGDATTVMVTVDIDTLATGVGTALLGDQPITAGEARRLACTAGLLPTILDGASQVLDMGRLQRLYQRSPRKALALRYKTCATDGCDIPATWCEAHHAGKPWAMGGRTDLKDGMLLCPFHHHRAHDHRYHLTRHPDGSVRFHLRT